MRSLVRRGVPQRLEVEQQVLHHLVAPPGILAKRLVDDALQLRRHGGIRARQRRLLALQHRGLHVRPGDAHEGPPPGDHLVEHHAERPDIGARVHVLPARLLWRHVIRGTDERARFGGERVRGAVRRGGRRDQLREAEVEDLHEAVRTDDHVGGLDVAMDDAGGVRGGEGRRHLDGDVDGLGDRQELDEALIERHALDVLHREVAAPVGGLAEQVDVRDVRMAQGRGGACLPLEPRQVVRLDRAAVEHLDGDGAVQRQVAGEIDLPHAAAAEQTHDLERSELSVRGEEHSWDRVTSAESSMRLPRVAPGAHNRRAPPLPARP